MDPQILQLMFALKGTQDRGHEHTSALDEEAHDPFPVQTVESAIVCDVAAGNPFPVQTVESATIYEQFTCSSFPAQPAEVHGAAVTMSDNNYRLDTNYKAHVGCNDDPYALTTTRVHGDHAR